MRLDAGLTGHELSGRCGWDAAKTSRIEHAKSTPSDADIRTWCKQCGHGEQAADLIAASRQVDSIYTEWRRHQRTGLRQLQDKLLPTYHQARTLRVYSSTMVPGILQTAGYATALLSTIARFRQLPNDAAAAAASRTERARILYEGGRRVYVVIDEAVLHRQFGDPTVMAEQLDHLNDLVALPSLALGIIPFGTRWDAVWLLESFHMFDDALVTAETLSAYIRIVETSEIDIYRRAFIELSRLAVYESAARRRIETARRALG
jgi:transcriptional regulator with XRE-family HTH domain